MEFERRKSQALVAISSSKPDKSPKGSLDAPIVALVDAINLHPSYFTTSSCSGRISILSHRFQSKNSGDSDANGESRKKKKAGGGSWVFITHDFADPDVVVDLLYRCPHCDGGDLVFRFEPLIVAVECRDVESAQAIVSTAISCGFRESGITSIKRRIIVAIRCSIRLEVPLGKAGEVVVSPEFVRYLVGIANEKMEANRKRKDGFLHVFQSKILQGLVDQKTDSNEKDQSLVTDKSLLDLEAKQNDVLSKIKVLEICTLESYNQNYIVDHVKDKCASNSTGYSGRGNDASFKDSLKDLNLLHELEVGYCNEESIKKESNSELSGMPRVSLSAVMLLTAGEPTEKLFLWGHSACTSGIRKHKQIIIFGGFGGIGRHERRNYSLMLDPQSGLLKEIDARGPPSPRLSHTASIVGENVFIIGGRVGPTQILNDVWVLHMAESRWMLLECTGSMFYPRHRHAAAAVGSRICVFGGLNGDMIYSCMNVLDTDTLQWSEVSFQGEWPCGRHSHSLVANGPLLFMFGGFDGEKALGDLYSFDTRNCLWKKKKTSGRVPFPRFSHSMFIYKDFLGIIGGCPIRQHNQELALLNLHHNIWIHVTVESVGRDLWVRSSTSVIEDDLIIVGGGTSCYAFGTKFNQPLKINLQLLDSVYHTISDKENKPVIQCDKDVGNKLLQCNNYLQATSCCSISHLNPDVPADGDGCCMNPTQFALQVEKKYAKLAKDVLKKFGWLDCSRKVQSSQDGHHILLPISGSFLPNYQRETLNSVDTFNDFYQLTTFPEHGLSLSEVSHPMALSFLLSCSSLIQVDDATCSRKVSKAPQKKMKESVCTLLRKHGMPRELLEQLPVRWDRLGDIVVLPVNSFKDPLWDSVGTELWPIVAKSLGAQRLARQGRILPTGTRDSTLEILVGDNGWVAHQENGILYSFDATKCMFSAGNLSEKLRMAHLDCRDETVVDLFAGIGYFVLPFLAKAKAKLVYACEWNPHAIEALKHNVHSNYVADRCIILEGDNRITAPKRVADRVCLGLLPSSEGSWATAVRALRSEGGVLHVHGNVNDTEEHSWLENVVRSIGSIAQSEGLCWDVSIQHLERVKWFGPHIRHLVADVKCRLL